MWGSPLPPLLALLACSGAAAWSIAEHGWVSVARTASRQRGERWVLTDEAGRELLFRGINIPLQGWRPPNALPMDTALYQGRCPPNSPHYPNPPLCGVQAGSGKFAQSTAPGSGNDLAQIRELGFDLVRLCITWSLLEPQPGVISGAYLDRIAQVVSWAKEQDVRVIIDMHQDGYSYSVSNSTAHYIDGAPAWAVLNASIEKFPSLEKWLFKKLPLDWHMIAAFRTFFANERPAGSSMGIQEHYIRAFAAVVRRFKDEPAVLGFEIMNEPPPSELELVSFSSNQLYPFYTRILQAVTGVRDGLPDCPAVAPIGTKCAFPDLGVRDTRHLFLFEPMALRNQLDFSLQVSAPFTSYTNIVFAPHEYTFSFTLQVHGLPDVTGYSESLDTAWREATKMRASVLVTEFGGARVERIGNITEQQDRHLTSSTFWVWKEQGGGWSMWQGNAGDPDFRLNADKKLLLSRGRPLAVSGALLSLEYKPHSGRLHCTAEVMDPNATAPTLLYVPPDVARRGFEVSVTGPAKLHGVEAAPDGSKTVEVALASAKAGDVYAVEILPSKLPVPGNSAGFDMRDRSSSGLLVI